ncbi:hypothetical protein NKH86_31105 [Mesorhizobium sp. M0913]|uniref:hypothetical protein n=1 Tax=Mesorhizobium sp. M0913 TaxID=2957026 RepID=UPI003339307E
MTNLPVEDLSVAVEKLGWYALRWKAEVFHKVMKSGCRAEEARLETAERLAKFPALIAVVSWRIFFVTMSARQARRRATFAEIAALDQINASRTRPRFQRPTLAASLLQIAMLDGFSPANMIRLPATWSSGAGMTRPHDIAPSASPLDQADDVGNRKPVKTAHVYIRRPSAPEQRGAVRWGDAMRFWAALN